MHYKRTTFIKWSIVNSILFFALSLIGCSNKSTIYFYSLDKSQCITVINEYDYRFVINGKHNKPPDTNFVKLHITNRNSSWDVLYVCWNDDKYEWSVVVDNSTILESKLDSKRFNFETEIPKDKRGIPTEIGYINKKCPIYSFYSGRLISNKKKALVEYETTRLGKIFYLLIILLFISVLNKYANRNLTKNAKKEFSKRKLFIHKKYFTKKGWFFKIFTYSLIGFFLFLLISYLV